MIIYLATPYTHPDPAVEEQRFQQACSIAAEFMSKGYHIFSPIIHCHPIRSVGGLPGHIDFWEEYDRKFIAVSGQLWITTMEGWYWSRGIKRETEIATELLVPIRYLNPLTLDLSPHP